MKGSKITTGTGQEQKMEKQIGCMAGFLNLFDRYQILTGKRLHSPRRLPSSSAIDTTSELDIPAPASPAISKESEKLEQSHSIPERQRQLNAELSLRSHLPLPVFNLKEGNKSSWKFYREAPRLSLDSRATTDAKGGLHPKQIRTTALVSSASNRKGDSIESDSSDGFHNRSPSVIARLMGLEPLPNSLDSESEKNPQLRRSASESRASKDLFRSRIIKDGTSFYSNLPSQSISPHFHIELDECTSSLVADYGDPKEQSLNVANRYEPSKKLSKVRFNSASHRRSFFDSGDVFPERKQSASPDGEIEKRPKIIGIDEPSKDLEALKQILEALQLKGLLHSKKTSGRNQVRRRVFVYDELPTVANKPSRSSISTSSSTNRRNRSYSNAGNQFRSVRRNSSLAAENSPSASPHRERNFRGPTWQGKSLSNSLVKPKRNDSTENPKVSPIHSPKLNPRRTGLDPIANNASRRYRKTSKIILTAVTVEDDESSSVSGSSIATTDTDRSKTVEQKEGRNLLERCDKLLHSIAEMNAADMQPSPVSVLDSSFRKDESLTTHSPVTSKRNLNFKDQSGELEEELWSPVISPASSNHIEASGDSDFAYISDILRASHYLSEDADVFLLLEKQQYLNGNDSSKVSRLRRKLIFDATNEILDRNWKLPLWKTVTWTYYDDTKPSLDKVWSEFQRIQEPNTSEDLFDVICGVLKNDLACDATAGWGDRPTEISGDVLYIEKLIFKDLIGDTIQELAALASRSMLSFLMPRRKLVF